MLVRSWLRLTLLLGAGCCGGCESAHLPTSVVDAGVLSDARDTDGDAADAATSAGTIDGRTPLEYYKSVCGFCHGDYRQGVVGPALVPSRLTQDRSAYAQTIRVDHRQGYLPENAHVLSDAELDLLLDLLLSPAPPPSAARWGEREIRRSLRVIVPDNELVDAPQHAADLDHLMLVIEHDAPRLAIIDGERHSLLARVYTNERGHCAVLHPTDARWVYTLSQDGIVSKVDLYALRTTRSVRTGIDARALAISDDGEHLIVGNRLPNSVVVLDADSLALEKRIATSGTDPDGMAVDSRVGVVLDVATDKLGPYFVVVLKEAGQVWRIDYSQPDFPVRTLEGVGHDLSDGFLSADKRRFYVDSVDTPASGLAVIDVARWELVERLPSLQQPHAGLGARWIADGIEYAASLRAHEPGVNVWRLSSGEVTGHVSTDEPGMFVRSHPQSPYVWVDAFAADDDVAHTLTVFDRRSATYEVVAHITDGLRTLQPEFTADASFVYVSDWDEGVVRVYDARYDTERKTFPLIQTIADLSAPGAITCTARRKERLSQ